MVNLTEYISVSDRSTTYLFHPIIFPYPHYTEENYSSQLNTFSMDARNYCLQCNNPLRGRSDKKFCNDYCRNSFNNKQSPSNTQYMRQVNAILRKNRTVLQSLLSDKMEITVTRHTLLAAGFHFSYITQIEAIAVGTKKYCYDFCYVVVNEDAIVIKPPSE